MRDNRHSAISSESGDEENRNKLYRRLKKWLYPCSSRTRWRRLLGQPFRSCRTRPSPFIYPGSIRAAAQPMTLQDRYIIVFNGEIYNYVELREELKRKGYVFTTRSDTEVLLAAFDCYQEACCRNWWHVCFCHFDEKAGSFFAARSLWRKTIFYTINKEEFCFASEKKALWAGGTERKSINRFLIELFGPRPHGTAADNTISFYEDIFSSPRSFCGWNSASPLSTCSAIGIATRKHNLISWCIGHWAIPG